MKVSLSICAKELSSATSVATGATLTSADNYYATVSRCNPNDDDDPNNRILLGTTNIAYQTQNPTWTQAIIFDYDNNNDNNNTKTSIQDDHNNIISITIYKHPTNTPIATHQFHIQDIWNTIPHHAVATFVTTNNEENESSPRTKILTSQGRQEKGIIMTVHMEEKVTTGSLQLKLRGKQLDNVDGRFYNLSLDKSDPFYEIKNKQGVTVYTSEVIANDLNPKWKESSDIDLTKLCRNDNDNDFRTAPLQIVVMDEDLHEDDPSIQPTKTELIGVVSTTIEELLVLANNNNNNNNQRTKSTPTPSLKLTRKGKVSGKLLVESAQLVGLDNASSTALQILERRAQIEFAEAKARVAERAKYYAAQLETISLQHQEKAVTTAQLLADIQTLAQDKQQAAQELKSQLKSQGSCTGTLQLKLCGRNLPDLDGILPGWGNKSDPFFEVYGYDGKVIYKSEVIRDNLNPTWKTVNLDLNALTHGNLNVKVRMTVYDQDPDDKREYMGQVLLSVNSMLASSSSSSKSFNLVKGLKDNGGQGQVIVQEAKLVNYVDLKMKADDLKKEAQDVLQSSYDMKKLSQTNAEAAQGTIVEHKKAQKEALIAEKEAMEAAVAVQELIVGQQ